MRNKVLEPAIKEINESPYSPFTVAYEPIRGGKGGGVKEVQFIIRKKESLSVKEETENDDADVVRSFISEPLSDGDIEAILKAANDDTEKVRVAYDAACRASDIHNLTAWMIRAIREGWGDSAPVKKRSSGFNNSSERNYDMDELEKLLLKTN